MKSNFILFATLLLAVCLTQFAADVYAPSLLAIAEHFDASIDQVQFSMSVYMLGVAFSQLLYGPLSEGYGRKLPMIAGLIIMLAGSIVCVMAPTIETIIWGRLIQGCGAGACACLWRTIFRDKFQGDALASYSSYLVIFIMFIVPCAPLLGGYFQASFGWFASFWFIFAYSFMALLGLLFGYHETNQNYSLSNLKLKYILSHYSILLKSPLFMGVTFSTFLSYGAFFSWFVVGPALIIDKLGESPVLFGWITFAGGGSAYALAGYLNGRYVKHFGMAVMMRFGWSMMIAAGAVMVSGYFIGGVNLYTIVIPMIMFYFGSTFIWPNAFAIAFSPFGHIAGYAGALYGFMQICGAAVLTSIISFLQDENQLTLGWVMLISPIGAWLSYELSRRLTYIR